MFFNIFENNNFEAATRSFVLNWKGVIFVNFFCFYRTRNIAINVLQKRHRSYQNCFKFFHYLFAAFILACHTYGTQENIHKHCTDLINSVCFLSFHISEIVTRLQIWREKLQVRFTICDWTVETDPELSFVENCISNLNHHFTFLYS